MTERGCDTCRFYHAELGEENACTSVFYHGQPRECYPSHERGVPASAGAPCTGQHWCAHVGLCDGIVRNPSLPILSTANALGAFGRSEGGDPGVGPDHPRQNATGGRNADNNDYHVRQNVIKNQQGAGS